MNGQGEDAAEYLAFMRFGDLVQLLLPLYGEIQTDSDKLEPERCAQCGSWKLVNVPCKTCQRVCAHMYVTDADKTEGKCGKCGITFAEWHG
jgi:hypothetical protein